MSSGLKVLFVGSRILPFRHPGDKNFWLDLIQELSAKGDDPWVLSITLDRVDQPSPFRMDYLRPLPVYLGARQARYNAESRWLEATNNYVSRSLTYPRIIRAIHRVQRIFHPDVVHFIDNYGPAMAVTGPVVGSAPLTISAPTYHRNRPFYDSFLAASFWSFDTVVPFSTAYKSRLIELGLGEERTRVIHWGVDPERFHPPSPDERLRARAAMGMDAEELVVLWTGFTQQTTERDLDFALRAARLVLERSPGGGKFVFCFKPAHFKELYRRFEIAGLRVLGTAEAFASARCAADILLAPVLETDSTVAPPLVWLECLAMGIPILTTGVPGAEEVIFPSKSGFMVRSPEEAADLVVGLASDRKSLRPLQGGARETARTRFSVQGSAGEYHALWSQLSGTR